jgi:NADPH2:quinone reductase
MIAYGHPGPRALCEDDAIVRFETHRPEVRGTDILVRVAYVGMNALDAKLRATGKATADQPRILGFEGAGRIEAIGPATQGFSIGDRVAWLGQIDRPGAMAEYACVDYRLAALVPQVVSLQDAAAMPMAFVTAYGLLVNQMGLTPDHRGVLLIVNGAGGVGSAALQIARLMTGMTVIATASRDQTRDWCLALGAHSVISHRGNLCDTLRDAGYRHVAAIASLTNTQTNFPDLVKCLGPHGVIGIIDQPSSLNAALLRPKAQRLVFEGAFVPGLMQPEEMPGQGAVLARMLAAMSEGTLRSIRCTDPLPISVENLRHVHRRSEAGSNIGKTVLEVSGCS